MSKDHFWSYEDFKAFPYSRETPEVMLTRMSPDDLVLFYDDYWEIIEQPSVLRSLAKRSYLNVKTDNFKALLRAYDRSNVTIRSYGYRNRSKARVFIDAAIKGNLTVMIYGWDKYLSEIPIEAQTAAFKSVAYRNYDEVFMFLFEKGLPFELDTLTYVAAHGSLDRLKMLYESPNFQRGNIETTHILMALLGSALSHDRPHIVDWLLEQGAEIRQRHLPTAARSHNYALLRLVLSTRNEIFGKKIVRKALKNAVKSGNKEIAERLLLLYPKILKLPGEIEALLTASIVGDNVEVASLLLKSHSAGRVTIDDKLMSEAFYTGDLDWVELFLKHGGR